MNNLTPNTTYQVKIRAKDISGNYSAFSNTISVTTNGPDIQAPTAPKNLSASNIQGTSFDLRWEKSTDNVAVDKYEIYIDNKLIGSAGAGGSAAKIPNLTPNTTYKAKIRAKDAAGNLSAFSTILTVKTLDSQAPTDPTNLRSFDITATSLKIQWTVSTDNVALENYEIFFDNVSRYSALPDANAVIIQNLTPNTTYTVKIRAKDTSGNLSGFSNTITVTTPKAPDTEAPTVPKDLIAFNETDKTFTINWKKSTDNVSLEGYEIYLGNTKKTTALPGASVLLIDGLTPNTTYTVKVRAKDTAGNYSAFSNVVTVKTTAEVDTEAPTSPSNLNASNIAQTSVNLSWNAATDNVGVTQYDIFQNNAKIKSVANTSTSISGLTADTAYEYIVLAKDAVGNRSKFSDKVTITTMNLISGCTNAISSLPYNQGFENTFGDWTQSSADDIDWSINSNYTPSYRTGPSSADQGTYYMYVEASGNGSGFPNKRAILNSPCIDLTNTSNPKLSFSYHMYGATDMGSISLQAKRNGTNNWITLWEETGNKGNNWLTASIDLNQYIGSTIALRFNRLTGATWQADIAIDNVSLSDTSDICEGVSPWDANKRPYNVGDKVTYYGNLFMRNASGWDGLGACGEPDTNNTRDNSTIKIPLLEEGILKIYPNPVTTALHILVPTTSTTRYTIIDMFGRIVAAGKYAAAVDVSSLESGSYILQIISPKKKYTKQFIKE